MIRWFKVLYPSYLLWAYFLAPFAIVALGLVFALFFGLSFDMAVVARGAIEFCKRAYGSIPLPLCFIYGVMRVMPNHPTLNPKLGQLLRAAPWSQGDRLPFGPWYLVPQDLVLLIWWTLFFCYGASSRPFIGQQWWCPFLPVALCVFGYIVAAICSLFYMGAIARCLPGAFNY